MSRYCFRTDDDCDWYMIPIEKSKLFSELLAKGISDDNYSDFCSEFDKCYIDSPKHFTFENPEEV